MNVDKLIFETHMEEKESRLKKNKILRYKEDIGILNNTVSIGRGREEDVTSI